MTDSTWAKGDPTTGVTDWRLIVEARVRRVRTDLAEVADQPGTERERTAALEALAMVDAVVYHRPHWWSISTWWSGWQIERAWRALHEAEICAIAADPDLAERLPGICARAAVDLAGDDPRLQALEALRLSERPSRAERAVVVDALRGAFDASDEAHAAARSLRNKLFVAVVALVLVNTALGVLGLLRPQLVPLCTTGTASAAQQIICAAGGQVPSSSDIWLVQLMGALGATIAAVVLLIRRRPSLSPYLLAGYQALIKVLLGGLLAVVGVLALGAGLAEGLVCLRSQAALLLWAVLLGYAQQLGTRLLDNYADRLLNRVRPLEEAES